jgi:hypothetical protein
MVCVSTTNLQIMDGKNHPLLAKSTGNPELSIYLGLAKPVLPVGTTHNLQTLREISKLESIRPNEGRYATLQAE